MGQRQPQLHVAEPLNGRPTVRIVVRNLPAVTCAFGLLTARAAIAEAVTQLEALSPALAAAHAGPDGVITLSYLDDGAQSGVRMAAHLEQLATGFVVEADGSSIPLSLDVLTQPASSRTSRIVPPLPMLLPARKEDSDAVRESFDVARDVLDKAGGPGIVLIWNPVHPRDRAQPGFFEAVPCLLSAHQRLIYLYSLKPHLERTGLAFNLDVLVAKEALAHLVAEPGVNITIPISSQSLVFEPWWVNYCRTLAELKLADRVTLMITRSAEFGRQNIPRGVLAAIRDQGVGLALDGLTGDGHSVRDIVACNPELVRFAIPPKVAADPVLRRKLQQAVGMAVEQGREVMIDDDEWEDVLPGFVPDLTTGEPVDSLHPLLLARGPATDDAVARESADPLRRWRGLILVVGLATSWFLVAQAARFLF